MNIVKCKKDCICAVREDEMPKNYSLHKKKKRKKELKN